MAELWSDYTDTIVKELDKELNTKYKMTVSGFLSNPGKYAKQANIATSAQNMQEDVNKRIDDMLGEMSDQKKTLEANASKIDAITTQIAQNISMQAKQNKLPILKPVIVERDVARDEVIYVDTVDNGLLSFIEKLVQGSKYVADTTGAYKDYKIGEWVFSGDKNYVIRAYIPRSEYMLLEGSKEELDRLFDVAIDFLKRGGK